MPALRLSPTVRSLAPSATIAAAQKAKALKAEGKTVYEFTLGEPDFTTPEHICEAAIKAMKDGHTHYTPSGGLPILKKAVVEAYERDHNVQFDPTQVLISNGAKHSIHNVLSALCGPGDDVIIPTPYWVSYSALVELTGAKAVLIETTEEEGLVLTPEKLKAAITPYSKVIMLNSPSNPTGVVYPPETLKAIVEIAIEHDLWVLTDEIYGKLIYDGYEFCSLSTLGADALKNIIIVDGVSKAYAMTGWRIGWTVGPANVIKAMDKLQSQQTSNPCSISQYAAIAAISGPQDCVGEMLTKFTERREYTLGRLRNIADLSFVEPGGAFYAFFNVSKYFGKTLADGHLVQNSSEFCTALLESQQVALVTGDAFGAPGFVRLSFATDLETIKAGLDRLETFLKG